MKKILLSLAFACAIASAHAEGEPVYWKPVLHENIPNPGFVHPGLLHTSEDFARIKRQVAAGDPNVLEALKVLQEAEYAQSNCRAPGVCDTIFRGGGHSENYISASRAATIAYQNALRWHIEGNDANARKAVEVLNAWAAGCVAVSGDSNRSLAFGLNGYAFAQAAELMRDYHGWSREDFNAFCQWMLDIWYRGSLDFLLRRHDTWLNSSRPNMGPRPGHYWSNWGLCNVLNLMSIGVLCDDVTIYNQGVSFFKYNHNGSTDPEGSNYLSNHGLNEYIGNLVPRLTEDDRCSLGEWGQMQESGRDQGHSLLAVGLASDVCQVAWNQGDDLFSIMDNRLAKGIEYVAAYNFGEVDDLPFYPYHYASASTAWNRVTPQDSISSNGRGGLRPIWGRIVAHYQGVKGIPMPYAVKAMQAVGPDWGGKGSVSGGYDHMGYTILMCTPENLDMADVLPADQKPTPIKGHIITANGEHQGTEYGAIAHAARSVGKPLAAGTKLTLCAEVADDSDDSGLWEWSNGATTSSIEIEPHRSGIWRVTYTNAQGVKSQQIFTIAAVNDNTTPDEPEESLPILNARSLKEYVSLNEAVSEAEDADSLLVRGVALATDRVPFPKQVVIWGVTDNAAISRVFNNKLCLLANGGKEVTIANLTLTSNGNDCSTPYLEVASKSSVNLVNVTLSGIRSSHNQGLVALKTGAIASLVGVTCDDVDFGQNSAIFFGKSCSLSLDSLCAIPSIFLEERNRAIAVGEDFATDSPIALTLANPDEWQTGTVIVNGTRSADLFTLANDSRGIHPAADEADNSLTVGQQEIDALAAPCADADAAPVYYNLQGMRVANPLPGHLYINNHRLQIR